MSEKNQHITKAIQGLPVFKAPDKIWGKIKNRINLDHGKAYLVRAIEDMRVDLKAPDHIWENLEVVLEKLKQTAPLTKAIHTLPSYTAPELFQEVYNQKEKRLLFGTIWRWTSGIAAGLLMVLGAYYFSFGSREQVTLTTTTEEISTDLDKISIAVDQLKGEDEILELIEAHCSHIITQCDSPEFEGLFSYYQELDDSKKELLSVIADNQDVQLVDYLIRVEKEKNEVGKQLLQMIMG